MLLPSEIAQRAAAIRLDKKALSERAGLSQKTTGMTLRGQSSPRFDGLKALSDAVETEERRLRDYLLALHPVTTDKGGQG